MLPLDLPGIAVTTTEADGPIFAIHAGCEGRPVGCTTCGSANFIGHGQYKQDVMDLPHHNRFTCIHLARKRYRCKDCEATFFHPLEWIDDNHRATKRFVDKIAELALDRNFSEIAREYGISEHGVRTIFYGRHKETIDTTQFQTPEYMGIDEIKIAGTGRGVVTNLSNNSAIEFLKDCSSKTFREYFERMPDRELVKGVAMDCTKRYKTLIHELFPKARVVADKFHILKMADDAVPLVRTKVRKECESKRTQLKLKHDKYILKTREHNLEKWQRDKLDGWREVFPAIGIVYDLKEEYYRIYDAKSSQEAKLRFQTWLKKIPPDQWQEWSATLTCWGNWEKEILAFFEVPITNAYTECQNGLTRVIDRMGRSYSFEAIRVKLLLAPKKQGMVTSYRSIRRRKKEEPAMARYMCLMTNGDDGYETVQVPERKLATFGVDIAKLEEWIEEDLTGQKRLPGVG